MLNDGVERPSEEIMMQIKIIFFMVDGCVHSHAAKLIIMSQCNRIAKHAD